MARPRERDAAGRPRPEPVHLDAGLGPALVELAAWLDEGRIEGPAMVVVPDEAEAQAVADGLSLLRGARSVVSLAPGPRDPTLPARDDPAVAAARVAGLYAVAAPQAGTVVVGAVAAWVRRTIPGDEVRARAVSIQSGTQRDRDAVVAALAAAGYRRVPVVGEPGDMAVRGGIVDVLAPSAAQGVRIEWFGDDVESIRRFDPLSQRSGGEVEAVTLPIVRETLVTDPAGLRARVTAAADALALPSRLVRAVLDRVEARDPATPWQALAPLLHARAQAPFEMAPEAAAWIVFDGPRAAARHRARRRAVEAAVARARAVPAFAARPADYVADPAAFERHLARAAVTVGLRDAPAGRMVAVDRVDVQALVSGLARARRGHERVADLLRSFRPFDDRTITVLAAPSPRRARDLAELMEGDVAVTVHEADAPSPSALAPGVHVVVGRFPATCALADRRIVVVGHRDLFGETSRASARRRRADLAAFSRLRPGDHVVHRLHGVGRFEGLVRLSLRGTVEEFAKILYAGGDKLYLPVLRIGEVEPFVGTGDRPPVLDRLGGHTFARRKAKVRADVAGFAEGLLRLYAERAARRRPPYPPLDEHDAAFAATFPFEETPDQQAAIAAVHADLSGPRPMDRLVCGDVGFGKTEVALRAIFRVAASGRQAALLAPTTVLARQHERTLAERLEPFGLRVAGLHRFVPAKARRAVVEGLRAGTVDVVVGTHRLLQKDVRFARLGLVVIDEEQRFGVRHKERLARLRADVDVLSMSATPIPRTLHMALSGLRDVSLLATPPPDRLAVETVLAAADDRLVADAIGDEIGRGGQVFFVVPRILDLEPWRARLGRIVPEVRVAVAHGKMPARRLEAAMMDFVEGRVEVLLCTTIAENGLDIPRANTLVVAGADRFGMAQLHQLRGRVGRSHVRARAYLLVPNLAGLDGGALARLSAVVDHADLGAGFELARRDLELRGAGELLGARQSGAIARIGFEAYARMIERAVAELEGRVLPDEQAPEVSADVPAYLPDTYLPDPVLRLDAYRRLAQAASLADVAAAEAAMEDRYGRLPPEAQAFVELSRWQVLGRRLGAEAVELTRGRLVVRFAPDAAVCPSDPFRGTASRWAALVPGEGLETLRRATGILRTAKVRRPPKNTR